MLQAKGQDVELPGLLAQAVRWHTEHRVLLNGHRTVVFRLSTGPPPPPPTQQIISYSQILRQKH